MKVLHICYSDSLGGGSIGAYRLHLAMRARGVDSQMLVAHKGTNDLSVIDMAGGGARPRLDAADKLSATLRELYGLEGLPIRSTNLFGLNVSRMINEHDADIVQLHWVANNTLPLSELPKINKPIVWKLPDMWAFSGGEHYIRHGDPERYKIGYDKSEPFRGETVDVDRFLWEAKRKYYRDLPLTITSPSRFMARCAHESVLMSPYDAHFIPNPLPSEFIYGQPASQEQKQSIRRDLGLPEDKCIALFSAFMAGEKRKGYHHLEKAAKEHLHHIISSSDFCFVVAGGPEDMQTAIGPFDVFVKKKTQDTDKYLKLLQACDLLMLPSEMDNSAMTVQEALAQGVPSIVFDVGGMPDLVLHKRNGYLAEPYKAKDFAEGVRWWLDCENKTEVRNFASQRARHMHAPAKTVAGYLKVYEQAIARYREKRSFKTGQLFAPESPDHLKTPTGRAFIIDPSAIDLKESSHHAEHVLAFGALFQATGITPHFIVNKNASFENPYGDSIKTFSWSIYDKIRSGADKREKSALDEADLKRLDSGSEKSHEVYEALKLLNERYEFSQRDVVIIPTIDRFCVEGILLYLFSQQVAGGPTFHINIMFEKAAFLLGGYPLEKMMAILRQSGQVGEKIHLYAETQYMADDLSGRFDVPIRRLWPPTLFSGKQLDAIKQADKGAINQSIRSVFTKVEGALDSEAEPFNPPSGKTVIASLGRGRRDKGWGELPAIVEEFNKSALANSAVFVVQKPRAMDDLSSEEERLAAQQNVILLDEIISTSLLQAVCDKTDVFLLPYQPGVYRKRGSAFCWRAVSHGQPVVVNADTALSETLLRAEMPDDGRSKERWRMLFSSKPKHGVSRPFANGAAATSAESFAAALVEVIKNLDSYKTGAANMRANYFRENVKNNPIKEHLYKDNYFTSPSRIVLSDNTESASHSKEADGLTAEIIIHMDEAVLNAAHWPIISSKTDRPVLRFTIAASDGVLTADNFPGFIRDAIAAQRVEQICVPVRLAVNKGVLRGLPDDWLRLVHLTDEILPNDLPGAN
ncbi:MAG: glycosyltransferase [Pseudomonadota bacterium]